VLLQGDFLDAEGKFSEALTPTSKTLRGAPNLIVDWEPETAEITTSSVVPMANKEKGQVRVRDVTGDDSPLMSINVVDGHFKQRRQRLDLAI
jgi:hypothetical protein